MPYTHFPNGLTTISTDTGGTAGNLRTTTFTCTSAATISGRLTATTSDSIVGERVVLSYSATSAAATEYIPVPFDGEVKDIVVTASVASCSAKSFSFTVNSAGNEISAASTGAFNSAGNFSRRNTITAGSAAVTSADSIKITGAAGATAAVHYVYLTLQRTS